MNKTIKSTFIILLCAVGLTACNAANSRHHNNTAAALVVGIGVGTLLHGHGRYKHSHRNARGHSHSRPQRVHRPNRGYNNRPHRGNNKRPIKRPIRGHNTNYRPHRNSH